MNVNDDITSLLDELSSFNLPAPHTQRVAEDNTPLNPDDLQQYVLNKSKALVETTLGAVQDLAPGIVAGSDAKEIEALSKLASSAAMALEAIQKMALIDKKADRDEKLEKMRLEGKKEIVKLAQGTQQVTNNNFLVASREEIMKKLMQSETKEILEIEDK